MAVRAADKPAFVLTDARGDDHGDGRLKYPLNGDIKQGDLDLRSLSATPVSGGTKFEATFAKPIRVPGRQTIDAIGTSVDSLARFGFYTFNIDIYIDTDRVAGSGSTTMLPGRKAEVAAKDAWERVIAVTPRPYETRAALRDIVMKQTQKEIKNAPNPVSPDQAEEMKKATSRSVEEFVYFPTDLRVRGSRIEFFVPDSFLGAKASDKWGYVVVVTGAELTRDVDVLKRILPGDDTPSLAVMPYQIGRSNDVFGGADESGMAPPIVDVITSKDVKQEVALRGYDMRGKSYTKIPAVVPAEQ